MTTKAAQTEFLRTHRREARIIAPWPLNVELEQALADAFGGFTRFEAMGAWRNVPAQIVRERVYVYAVAMLDRAHEADQLRQIALRYRADAAQQCVYVCFADGHVEFVE